jgi:hypothetical protein
MAGFESAGHGSFRLHRLVILDKFVVGYPPRQNFGGRRSRQNSQQHLIFSRSEISFIPRRGSGEMQRFMRLRFPRSVPLAAIYVIQRRPGCWADVRGSATHRTMVSFDCHPGLRQKRPGVAPRASRSLERFMISSPCHHQEAWQALAFPSWVSQRPSLLS